MGYKRDYYKRHKTKYDSWERILSHEFYKFIKISSIIYLGCGVGSYLLGFYECGLRDMLGLEINLRLAEEFIDERIRHNVIEQDITKEINISRKYDCVWSVEVGEHICPEDTIRFIKNLCNLSSRYILFTAAPPGQRGSHHQNCREKSFWIQSVCDEGMIYKKDIEDNIRELWSHTDASPSVLRNLMFFEKA